MNNFIDRVDHTFERLLDNYSKQENKVKFAKNILCTRMNVWSYTSTRLYLQSVFAIAKCIIFTIIETWRQLENTLVCSGCNHKYVEMVCSCLIKGQCVIIQIMICNFAMYDI